MHSTLSLTSQKWIGWDQVLCGRLSKDWIHAICIYYNEHKPGIAYNPDHWMRTTINALWTFSMTLWRKHCESYHGLDGIITIERQQKDTANKATELYQQTIGNINPMENIILHRHQLQTMMNWTKQHLDTYLTTTEVICEWNVEPGWLSYGIKKFSFSVLHLCTGCGAEVILHSKISLVISEWL